MRLYEEFARAIIARNNCINTGNIDWQVKHEERINNLINQLPHGLGIDAKTEFDFENSGERQLIFYSSYHYMNENGMYDGWIDFKIRLTPSFLGFDIRIIGSFMNKYSDIKDYLYYIYNKAFDSEVK